MRDAAVVISVAEHPSMEPVADVDKGARDWARWLLERGMDPSRLVMLSRDEAAGAEVALAIASMALEVDEGGQLWVVFLGRGALKEGSREPLLLCAGATGDEPASHPDLLPITGLLELARAGRQQHTVVVSDLCLPDGEPFDLALEGEHQGATLLAAARACRAPIPLGLDVPPFSYFVLGGLQGWADANSDGWLTGRESSNYALTTLEQLGAEPPWAAPVLDGDRVITRGTAQTPDLDDVLDRLLEHSIHEKLRALDEQEDRLRRQARMEWSFLAASAREDLTEAWPRLETFADRYGPAILTASGMDRWVLFDEAQEARALLPQDGTQRKRKTVALERQIQLTEEMRQRARRNAWSAVEASYVQVRDLENQGVQAPAETHLLGATAARAMGRVADVRERLLLALAREPSTEVLNWLNELSHSYGRVVLKNERKESVELTPRKVPFAPDRRAALEHAKEAARKTGFEGYLPVGRYTYGGCSFMVVPGDPPAECCLDKERKR